MHFYFILFLDMSSLSTLSAVCYYWEYNSRQNSFFSVDPVE